MHIPEALWQAASCFTLELVVVGALVVGALVTGALVIPHVFGQFVAINVAYEATVQ
jgi:hypothetical protein